MISESLENKLINLKAYRKDRLLVAQFVLSNPETFPKLLDFCFKTSEEISCKAAWVLEFVFLENPKLLFPYLEEFFKKLPYIEKNQALRTMSKICELLVTWHYKKKEIANEFTFTEADKQILVECCFDWLLKPMKVATKAFAMTTLYYLGTQYNWIHPELKAILESEMPQQSAGYKARAKKTVQKIQLFEVRKAV